MHVERTFEVSRPVGEVFSYLSDFTHTEAWDPGTITTRQTGGDGGLGTTYANRSTFMGREVELTYETITYEIDRRLQFRGTNSGSTATDSMSFSPTATGGTEIHYRADFEFTSTWVRLLAPLAAGRKLGAVADETVQQLRDTLA